MKAYRTIKFLSKTLIYFSVFALVISVGIYYLDKNKGEASASSCPVGMYKQWNTRWASTPYVSGYIADVWDPAKGKKVSKPATIGTSGCGPTSLAMVINYIKYKYNIKGGDGIWHKTLPTEMASYCYSVGARPNGGGTDAKCFSKAANKNGFVLETINKSSISKIRSILSNGDPIIAVVGYGSERSPDYKYTHGGHYIVLTKIVGDTIYINDPNSKDGANTSENINKLLNFYLKPYPSLWYIHHK